MPGGILDNLTAPQREAVTHKDGPMIVIAGAGSGKTRVVTRRIAWLISQGVWPSQILAMTFTNKAAKEMRERVEALVGEAPQNVGTFHGCCARFLRRDIDKLNCGRTRDFTIYDETDQKALLKKVLEDHTDLPKSASPGFFSNFISSAKNSGKGYLDAATDDGDLPCCVEEAVKIAMEYDERLKKCNAVDFDDLLRLMVELLQKVPGMQEIYHNRFRYLLIDEYQDTNRLQYLLMKLLTNEQQNVHVTGDPDQSIYSWRGADYQNIMSFTLDFPNARMVKLEQNYRSTPNILNAANALILHNTDRIDKALFTENPDGAVVTDVLVETDRDEAEWIRRKIDGAHRHGHPWRNFAIFYRTNAQSRAFEEEFIHFGIPYQLMGGVRFYDRKEVKDFLALIRLRVNPNDQQAFQRIVENFPQSKGLGKRAVAMLIEEANAKNLPLLEYLASQEFRDAQRGKTQKAMRLRIFSEWLAKIHAVQPFPVGLAIKEIDDATDFSRQLEKQYGTENLDARKDNINSFIGRAEDFERDFPEATLAEFLEDVALVADVDAHDPTVDSVVLMTLHSAKGLEFPCVFITGVEDGLLPHAMSQEEGTPEEIEEERRLFYVGITRAQRAAYLTHTKLRYRFGKSATSITSPFLLEIPLTMRQRKEYRNGMELPRNTDDYDTPYVTRRWR